MPAKISSESGALSATLAGFGLINAGAVASGARVEAVWDIPARGRSD